MKIPANKAKGYHYLMLGIGGTALGILLINRLASWSLNELLLLGLALVVTCVISIIFAEHNIRVSKRELDKKRERIKYLARQWNIELTEEQIDEVLSVRKDW